MTHQTQEDKDEVTHQSSDYLETFKPRAMDWSAARTFAMKNLRIALRYPANIMIWGFLPLLWFAPYILMATAVGGPETTAHFTEISGYDDFIQFVIIGWFVFLYLDNSIWGIGNNFRWEQFSGTLEPLFSTPVPRISILLGAAFSDSIQGTIQAMILLLLSMSIFGVSYALTAIAPTIIVLLIMVIGLYGFGFMVAGMILVFKDPSVLTQLVSETSYMISPVNYPINALPKPVQFAAYLLPTTIGIITIREIAITGAWNLLNFSQAVLALGGLAIVFWLLGLATFQFAEKWTKQRGHMGGF
ncbi:MAG: ABC transporter permease [Candidatus Thorarchaeota archaeon]|nr:ABC transporter permease [Candidatus Thorarchaeota archaeon]